jgi:hypothetical protein
MKRILYPQASSPNVKFKALGTPPCAPASDSIAERHVGERRDRERGQAGEDDAGGHGRTCDAVAYHEEGGSSTRLPSLTTMIMLACDNFPALSRIYSAAFGIAGMLDSMTTLSTHADALGSDRQVMNMPVCKVGHFSPLGSKMFYWHVQHPPRLLSTFLFFLGSPVRRSDANDRKYHDKRNKDARTCLDVPVLQSHA